jgi:hypothetical protein
MSKAEEYLNLAANCVRMAIETDIVCQKAALIDMASSWLKLAEQAEKNSQLDLVYGTPTPEPTHGSDGAPIQ